jgi:hypothetical protein
MIFFGSTSFNENECLWACFSGGGGDIGTSDSGACGIHADSGESAVEATAAVGSVWNGLRNNIGVAGTDWSSRSGDALEVIVVANTKAGSVSGSDMIRRTPGGLGLAVVDSRRANLSGKPSDFGSRYGFQSVCRCMSNSSVVGDSME